MALAVLAGCMANAPDWECNADNPCPSGQGCHALDDADPKCFDLCDERSQTYACPDPSHACVPPGVCVPFSASCMDSDVCPVGWYCNQGSLTCARQVVDGSSCESHESCQSGYCSVGRICCSASCRPNGEACTSPAQCFSGYCVDGQCCSGPCDGACEHCVAGACEPIADGADPNDAECPGATSCSGARACHVRTLGAVCDVGRDDQCVSGYCADGSCCQNACADICERCDAMGACVAVTNATDPGTCSAAEAAGDCPPGSACECDGSGACKLSAAQVCSEGAVPNPCPNNWPCLGGICCASDCAPDTCRSCNSDHTGQSQGVCAGVLDHADPRDDCTGQLSCDGAGSCYNKAAGTPCGSADECASSWCVDGYCCSTECDGLCEACDGLFTGAGPGNCGAIYNGQDPGNECSGGAACQGGGLCWNKGTSAACNFDYECVGGICTAASCAAITGISLGGTMGLNIGSDCFYSCAVLDNGAVKCWGCNSYGQLGQGDVVRRGDDAGEMGDSLLPISLGSGATAVAVGSWHSCARLNTGAVKCWGYNSYGQLGLGDTSHRGDGPGEMGSSLPTVSLGTGRTAVEITAGDRHTCARLDNGQVKCWGGNGWGQLGLGNTQGRGDNAGEMGDSLPAVDLGTGRTAQSIVAGRRHTCALLDNYQVKCWGDNALGQLGLGDTDDRGNNAGEMGDALPSVNLGTGLTATQVAGRWNHTCARLNNGSVKCWGENTYGKLGVGDTNHRGDASGEMGDALPAVDLGTAQTAVVVTTATEHSCARLGNGGVKCWGGNSAGQLGQGDTITRGDAAGELGDSLQPVDLGTVRTAGTIAAGAWHVCARLDNGQLKCWGSALSGALGLGPAGNSQGDEPGEMGDNLPGVDL